LFKVYRPYRTLAAEKSSHPFPACGRSPCESATERYANELHQEFKGLSFRVFSRYPLFFLTVCFFLIAYFLFMLHI
jgi:hypothetical protein